MICRRKQTPPGEHVTAEKALAWGVVDAVSDITGQPPLEAATALCKAKAGENLDSRRLSKVQVQVQVQVLVQALE